MNGHAKAARDDGGGGQPAGEFECGVGHAVSYPPGRRDSSETVGKRPELSARRLSPELSPEMWPPSPSRPCDVSECHSFTRSIADTAVAPSGREEDAGRVDRQDSGSALSSRGEAQRSARVEAQADAGGRDGLRPPGSISPTRGAGRARAVKAGVGHSSHAAPLAAVGGSGLS